jgi:hypothetical protein
MDELVAENYIDHNPPPSRGLPLDAKDQNKRSRSSYNATPGYHHIEDQIAEGDKVVTQMTGRSYHASAVAN